MNSATESADFKIHVVLKKGEYTKNSNLKFCFNAAYSLKLAK